VWRSQALLTSLLGLTEFSQRHGVSLERVLTEGSYLQEVCGWNSEGTFGSAISSVGLALGQPGSARRLDLPAGTGAWAVPYAVAAATASAPPTSVEAAVGLRLTHRSRTKNGRRRRRMAAAAALAAAFPMHQEAGTAPLALAPGVAAPVAGLGSNVIGSSLIQRLAARYLVRPEILAVVIGFVHQGSYDMLTVDKLATIINLNIIRCQNLEQCASG